MPYGILWSEKRPQHFPFSTVTQAVTQSQHSVGRGTNQHGRLGLPTLTSLRPSGSKSALSLDNRWPHFKLLDRYTFIIYDKTRHSGSINEARRELFCQKNKTMEHIQPTQDSLLQQSKRVAYQSGIWATCELAHHPTPSSEGCGWTLD